MPHKFNTILSWIIIMTVFGIPALYSEEILLDNWAERYPSKIAPPLEEALRSLPPNGTLDVYAVMKERLSAEALQDMVKGVPLQERHKVVTAALQGYAKQSQKNIKSFLAKRKGMAAHTPVTEIWLSNALRFTGTAEDIQHVRARADVGYLGLIRDFPKETYQDIDTGADAALPYYDGFESGSFGPEWDTFTTGTGRIQLTTANGPIGTYHVTMDSSVDNSYGNCLLTLSIDLSSESNCFLEFMFKEWSDEADPEDHVSISEDGVTFYPVLSLGGDSSYAQKFLDIDAAASANGISLTSNFKIRFSWRDNYPITTDGFAFDEIKVESGDPPPSPPTQNVVNLQAPDCWNIGVTGAGVLILNIDSGVDYLHADLAGQIWSNPGEAPYGANGVDDDGNGYIDDIRGWDFEDGDNDPYPTSYHGTATAGIVCGNGAEGTKTGMAPDATMAVAKIGDMGDYWLAQQYAVLIGARAITSSYSYKWGIHDPDYHMFRTHCENELIAGIIHANSIGNQGNDTVSYPIPFNISTPGNCPGPWIHPQQVEGGKSSVMGCAGIYLDESLYTSSGQGPSAWEDMLIYDPGYMYAQNPNYWDYPYGGFGGGLPGLLKPDVCTYTDVTTTDMGGGYRSFGGTSAATPHLGGAMCLLISGNPHVPPAKISRALQETAEDKGPAGKDLRYGAGKIQVYDALLRIMHNFEVSNLQPALGETIDVEISGVPGAEYALVWSFKPGQVVLGFGTFDMGPPLHIPIRDYLPPSGVVVHTLPIPNLGGLAGKTIYMQTAMDDRSGMTGQVLFSLVETLEIQP